MAGQTLTTITIPAASTTPIVVTGLGHTPEVILAFWSGRTETVDAFGVASAEQGFGVAINAATQFSTNRRLVAGAVASANSQALRELTLVATELGGKARVGSIEADGFILEIDSAFVGERRVHIVTLGPERVTNKALFLTTTPTATGPQSLTAPGFQPDAAIFFSNASSGSGDNSSHADASLGWAAGVVGSIVNFAVVSHSRGNGASADSSRWGKSGFCYGEPSKAPNANALVERASVTDWLSNGIELTFDTVTAGGANEIAVLALAGPGFRAGAFNLGEKGVSGLPWVPRVGLFASHWRPEQIDLEMNARDAYGVGAMVLDDSGFSQRSMGATNQDGLTSQDVGTIIDYDAIYARLSDAPTKKGEVAVASLRNDGFGLTLVEGSDGADLVGFLVLGEGPPTITQDRSATVPSPPITTNRIATFIKDPDATLDYAIDWTAFLTDELGNVTDSLVSSQWIAPSGITVEQDPPASFASPNTRVWLSGGTLGTNYEIVNRISTADGRINDRTIRIKIKAQ